MKNKLFIISWIIIIISIIIFIFLYSKSDSYIVNNDIKKFNSLNSKDLDINICKEIKNIELKEKCIDNYYSIKAFLELDSNICEKILSEELKNACKKEILKFN